jgi:transcriptional regulator with XRE-family HTH domain
LCFIRTDSSTVFLYDISNGKGKVGGSVDELKKFQANVRFFRIKKGLSQSQLAEKLNVTRPVISKLETGKQQPSLEQLIQISEVLEVSIDHLLGRGEKPQLLTDVLEPYYTEKHLEEVVDYLMKHPDLYHAIEELAKSDDKGKKYERYIVKMIKELLKID